MKTISMINLKGGVGKTISCCNIAHILATVYGKRVLLIDNDKQGNASKFFHLHDYERLGTADLLMDENTDVEKAIMHTEYENLDLIQGNTVLIGANDKMVKEKGSSELRLKKAVQKVGDKYDYCLIDNAPEISMSIASALIASDEVLIPLTVDKFASDGLDEINIQIESAKEFNENLCVRGCFVTQWRNNHVNREYEEWLKERGEYKVFNTHIRRTEKITESTFAEQPIILFSRRSAAAIDYLKLVAEYLEGEE